MTGEKPHQLSLQEEPFPHYSPVFTVFNALKHTRGMTETGLTSIPLTDILLYIKEVLGYSDRNYIRWLCEMVMACDSEERLTVQENISRKNKPKKSKKP
jgi:hypothetical protein